MSKDENDPTDDPLPPAQGVRPTVRIQNRDAELAKPKMRYLYSVMLFSTALFQVRHLVQPTYRATGLS
jgi:hypothetical protein